MRSASPPGPHGDAALHSLEPDGRTVAQPFRQGRRHQPMGCQTGFYVAMINHDDYDDVLQLLQNTLEDVLTADAVPACNEMQCGWAANHSLGAPRTSPADLLAKRAEVDSSLRRAGLTRSFDLVGLTDR
ncbi:hypothetical protein DSL92_04330 [Billgrantia gudaonensis]|uniref:S-ribosylhomocysteine lyase n=1 Tax=Billgrantia gudaonensis TaxID=376427 RepID=A0A3S0QRW5_9GAMM|nr:hypothetical protein DSL92_04330 [Halomonas gudaonensis]